MHGWLLGKLDNITDEFLGGSGQPMAYEAQYLAYLECLAYLWHGPDKAGSVWEMYREWLQERTPGEPVRALYASVADRQEMVRLLRAFHKKYEGPFPRKFIPPANNPEFLAQKDETPVAQDDDDTRSEDAGMSIFELFHGDEE